MNKIDDFKERRANTRIGIRLPVELVDASEHSKSKKGYKPLELVDISEGGVCLISSKPIDHITNISINFPSYYSDSPTSGSRVNIRAEIIWSSSTKKVNDLCYGTRFTDIRKKDKEIIRNIVKSELLKLRSRTLSSLSPIELSKEAIQNLLDIKGYVPLTPEKMAKNLRITIFPSNIYSKQIISFSKKIIDAMKEVGVNIIPYNDALVEFGKKQKIKKGIVTIVFGEGEEGNLPMDHVQSFTHNPIVTIIDAPDYLKANLSYKEYMDIGLHLFVKNASHTVICIREESWMVLSLNGYSPFYKIDDNFKETVLNKLIPKISTRVFPPSINEFEIIKSKINFIEDSLLKPYIEDIIESCNLLSKTGLFYQMKKIDDFKFRTEFYKLATNAFLDERKGMSYGFIARQLPVSLNKLIPIEDISKDIEFGVKDFTYRDNKMYILVRIYGDEYVLEVPPIWVLMSRSGSHKTSLDPYKDIIKVGLINGKMYIEIPPSAEAVEDYKPSFDTRIILAHCIGNAIYGSVIKYMQKDSMFTKILEKQGMALIHWHGDLLNDFIPRGWHIYGRDNPPVLCSSPQSAIYAFKGKGKYVERSILMEFKYLGDVQIEPDHGVNMTWKTLRGLSNYLLSTTD